MHHSYGQLKTACYLSNVSMSVVGNLPPLLFLTFRSLYGISFSLLGLLILINFVTQLTIDLIFSFFSHKFNISKTVKCIPLLTILGLLVYSLWPVFLPQYAYAGLVIGTVIYSLSAGLVEVLISPIIAALPADDPDREVSKLHSIYAWGVVAVILVSTLYLLIFGGENWYYLTLFFALVPLTSALLFAGSQLPAMESPQQTAGIANLFKTKGLWLCVTAIFLGGAAECTMAQWVSGYLEQAMGIPKVWGDVFGVAVFALMLGLGRTLYAKKGKDVTRVLLWGAVGAAICYLVAAVSPSPLVGLLACGLTGFCVSMLWPGCLIAASDRIPHGGVFLYAMMAAGGDLGASVSPQIIGIVTDAAIAFPGIGTLAQSLSLTPEALGMKLGMLVGMLFPVAAIGVYAHMRRTRPK